MVELSNILMRAVTVVSNMMAARVECLCEKRRRCAPVSLFTYLFQLHDFGGPVAAAVAVAVAVAVVITLQRTLRKDRK